MPVRLANVDDTRPLVLAHKRAWQKAYRGLVADHLLTDDDLEERIEVWQSRLASNTDRIYVHEDSKGEVTGFLAIGPARKDDEVGFGEIWAIYLHPDYWGRGYGGALLKFGLEELHERGFNVIVLWVLTNNDQARGFYERFGFQTDGATSVYDVQGDPQHVTRYRIELRE